MDHTQALQKAAEHYRERAVEMDAARLALADIVREAFAAGLRKADIRRAIGNLWSREWLDRVLDDGRSSDADG